MLLLSTTTWSSRHYVHSVTQDIALFIYAYKEGQSPQPWRCNGKTFGGFKSWKLGEEKICPECTYWQQILLVLVVCLCFSPQFPRTLKTYSSPWLHFFVHGGKEIWFVFLPQNQGKLWQVWHSFVSPVLTYRFQLFIFFIPLFNSSSC